MEIVELSPKKIIPNAVTVWNEHGSGVDLVMDLKNLTFKPGSISKIYAFHVADHFFPGEAQDAIKNWVHCLANGGELYVVVDDFEYTARGFVGGDISIDTFNQQHAAPIFFTRDNLFALILKAGIKDEKVVMWYDMPADTFIREPFEMVMCATK
jgi:predicted SAM-dependent methyltransferase